MCCSGWQPGVATWTGSWPRWWRATAVMTMSCAGSTSSRLARQLPAAAEPPCCRRGSARVQGQSPCPGAWPAQGREAQVRARTALPLKTKRDSVGVAVVNNQSDFILCKTWLGCSPFLQPPAGADAFLFGMQPPACCVVDWHAAAPPPTPIQQHPLSQKRCTGNGSAGHLHKAAPKWCELASMACVRAARLWLTTAHATAARR